MKASFLQMKNSLKFKIYLRFFSYTQRDIIQMNFMFIVIQRNFKFR